MAKSIRLNKEIRETILTNISTAYAKANNKPEIKITEEVIHKPLEDFVMATYKKKAKKIEEIIEANPEIFPHVRMRQSIRYVTPTHNWKLAGVIKDEEGNTTSTYLYDLADETTDFRNSELIAKSKPMQTAIDKYNKLKKESRKERSSLSDWKFKHDQYMEQCRQVVYGVNTTAQLVEVWAEVAKFIPAGYRDPSKIALPAVNVKALNDALGA